MQVKVVLYANLGRFHPRGEGHKEFSLEVPSGASVGAVLDTLKIPEEEHRQIFVNNQHRKPEESLEEGDRVAIFPPVAGG